MVRPRRGSRPGAAAIACLLAILSITSLPIAIAGPGHTRVISPPANAPYGLTIDIHDNQLLKHLFGISLLSLLDTERPFHQTSYNGVRSYEIYVNATLPLLVQKIQIATVPLDFWSQPDSLPNGADYLPPLSEWTWVITTSSGVNDTSNWSIDPTGTELLRTSVWQSQAYYVTGYTNVVANVTAYPGSPSGLTPTGGGFVVNAGGYPNLLPNVTGYQAMADALSPGVVRISLSTGQSFTGWNTTSEQPIFTFGPINSLLSFAHSTGGATLLSLPAGTWGDGNSAPIGTPVTLKSTLTLHGLSGHFLTPGAMYALVRQFANHTFAIGDPVEYWAIGNEIPLNSSLETVEYAKLLTVATTALHVLYPDALVGTDVRLSPEFIPTIAQDAPTTGFLGFHHYSTVNLCVQNGSLCPPTGSYNSSSLSAILGQSSFPYQSKLYTPAAAAEEWYNVTGHSIPLVNVETNLNIFGGGALNIVNGTDPRINDLAGAAWLGALLVDSSLQNVSEMAYFTLTSTANLTNTVTYNYGGFGFGLTNVTRTGAITQFAPYYVMKLWDNYLHPGAEGINVTNSAPADVDVFAVQSSTGVTVAVVNRCAAPVTVHLGVSTPESLNQVYIVDQRSYSEVYNATSNSTSIERSGISTVYAPPGGVFQIEGYGFALAQFVAFGVPP